MAEIEGMKELSKKLSALGRQAGGKALRNALNAGATVVKREMRANIPTGRRAHRTYKGRLVAPGFAKRSITHRSRTTADRTKAWARIGVKPEAYYAVQFLEFGTKNMRARPWFARSFRSKKQEVVTRFSDQLRKNILRLANDK